MTINSAATIFCAMNFSFKNTQPITTANSALVSRSADTGPIGPCAIAQTTIP